MNIEKGFGLKPEVSKKTRAEWEPFNLGPTRKQRFINLYGGPFSQSLEFNRVNSEKIIQNAALSGKIVLVNRAFDRSHQADGVNRDGSVAFRKSLSWGKMIEGENKASPLIESIPSGWKIEIPGQEVVEKLAEQKSTISLGERFAERMNGMLRASLGEIVVREKLSSIKDKRFKRKVAYSLIAPLIATFGSELFLATYVSGGSYVFPATLILPTLATALGYQVFNYHYRDKKSGGETMLPPVEVDRVLRGLAFINGKGRNLVRLRDSEAIPV